jgi:nucleoid-associated protein YgaU
LIFKGSRYSNADVVAPPGADGKSRRVLAQRTGPPATPVLQHVVADGERLDHLATRFYSEPTRYWLILDANPDVLNPFELLVTGKTIGIPQNRLADS